MAKPATKRIVPESQTKTLMGKLMATEISKPAPPELHPGWTVLPPENLPEPGIWPATLALGITFLVWGLVTSLIITGVGLACCLPSRWRDGFEIFVMKETNAENNPPGCPASPGGTFAAKISRALEPRRWRSRRVDRGGARGRFYSRAVF
jgi:hypothetical protein